MVVKCEELGYDCQVENGRVRFQGDVRAIIETNLWLRAADRIKIIVGTFPAKTFEELFQGVFRPRLGKLFTARGTFPDFKSQMC